MNILNIDMILKDHLPSGSGFDCNWNIEQSSAGVIRAYNSYTCYSEVGCIDGYQDFYLVFKLVNCELHLIDFHFMNNRYLSVKYDLKQYFDHVFFESLPDTMQYYSTKKVNEYF